MEKWDKIKVGKEIIPIPFLERKPVDLIIGKEYYVSFGNNIAKKCVLTKIHDDGISLKRITIDIPIKPRSKKGYINIDGELSHNWKSTHTLYADEIGLTPEEAVLHEVTF